MALSKGLKKLIYLCAGIRLVPHAMFYLLSKNKNVINEDLVVWMRCKRLKTNKLYGFIQLIQQFPELRNVFYLRIGWFAGLICSLFLPKLRTLHIYTKSNKIGPGLYIGHGWSTVINAFEIGTGCQIFHNVTIGSKDLKEPTIGNNVTITAHSVILGNINVGDNVSIGAGSVIVKNIPPNCVVVPSKSVIIKQDGIRVHKEL